MSEIITGNLLSPVVLFFVLGIIAALCPFFLVNLSLEEKKQGWGQSPGSIAHYLKPYVEGFVPQNAAIEIERIEELNESGIRLVLTNGTEKIVNHIIAATGFHINLDRVPFFDQELLSIIERKGKSLSYSNWEIHVTASH
jgi:hypothetical protein